MTNAEELALVEAALKRLYEGDRVARIGDRTYTEIDLNTLIKRRDDLKYRVFRETEGHGGGGRGVPVDSRGGRYW